MRADHAVRPPALPDGLNRRESLVTNILVTTFYKFVHLDDPGSLQSSLAHRCRAGDVRGIILLATEGINATIAGPPDAVRRIVCGLRADSRFADLTARESWADTPPFRRLRVRLKREIVTLGVPDVDPAEHAGTYVSPQAWNALIEDPGVIVIDTRNDYEVRIGSFRGAVNPGLPTFRSLPQWIDDHLDLEDQPRVAMFCTGGIRCEKSTAFLRHAGVQEVYHLEGGILKYLETIPPEESLWDGECFVFDERVSVGHGLAIGPHELCRACREPLSPADCESPHYRRGVSCARCHDRTSPAQKARFAERQRQIDLARTRDATATNPR